MFFSWGRFGCHLFWGQIPMGVEPSIARDDDSRLNGYPMLFFMIINKLLVNPEKTHIRWLNDILRIYIYCICAYIYIRIIVIIISHTMDISPYYIPFYPHCYPTATVKSLPYPGNQTCFARKYPRFSRWFSSI